MYYMRYSKNMNPLFLSMRALQETNGAEGGDGVIEVVNGKTLEINGTTYNALAIAGIIVAGIIVLYMMFFIVCRKQKTVKDLRLTHVRTGMARGLIGFTFVSIILSAVIMVLAAQGFLDNPKYEAQWLAHGSSAN
jgi:Mn2+/Fe2+ NRAMP family transporter